MSAESDNLKLALRSGIPRKKILRDPERGVNPVVDFGIAPEAQGEANAKIHYRVNSPKVSG